MIITKDNVKEAQEVIRKGKEHRSSDTEWYMALAVLKEAFNSGYDVVKTH